MHEINNNHCISLVLNPNNELMPIYEDLIVDKKNVMIINFKHRIYNYKIANLQNYDMILDFDISALAYGDWNIISLFDDNWIIASLDKNIELNQSDFEMSEFYFSSKQGILKNLEEVYLEITNFINQKNIILTNGIITIMWLLDQNLVYSTEEKMTLITNEVTNEIDQIELIKGYKYTFIQNKLFNMEKL